MPPIKSVEYASENEQKISQALQPSKGKALLYIFRTNSYMGSRDAPNMTINNEVIGKLGAGTYIYTMIDPGRYEIKTKEYQEFMPNSFDVFLKEGQTYFVQFATEIGYFAYENIETEKGMKMLRSNDYKLSASNYMPEYKAQNTIVNNTNNARIQNNLTNEELIPVDIDNNIPVTNDKNKNSIAIVIAMQDYSNPEIPKVEYAKRDAQIIREYLVKSMGFDPKNILPRNTEQLITAGEFKTLIRNILPGYLRKDGKSDLFVYYTGHGAPNTTNHEAYLVPYDCNPNFVNDNNAYSMKEFYKDILSLNAKEKTIVIDACFSGQSGNGSMLIKNASPITISVKDPIPNNPNCFVFQSSESNQVSNWYPEKRHSMFTYFFLKGIQGAADLNNDGKITLQELDNYINDENEGLPYFSQREFQRNQKAVIFGKKDHVLVNLK